MHVKSSKYNLIEGWHTANGGFNADGTTDTQIASRGQKSKTTLTKPGEGAFMTGPLSKEQLGYGENRYKQ